MKLRGIEFGPCLDAAGVRGFFGEGWWFHHLPLARFVFNFTGSTRVAKTATLLPHRGNMPLRGKEKRYGPRELFPRCIWWSWSRGIALNAVGLSGPGTQELFAQGLLADEKAPFMISVMPVSYSQKERLEEFQKFCVLLEHELRKARLPIGLQINLSCPNTKLDPHELAREATLFLDEASRLNIPLVVKINILVPPEAAQSIARHRACDALCFSNTIPFGELPEAIPWKRWFPEGSPLARREASFGGGGLSGSPLLPLVAEYLRQLRTLGIEKPLNVGGGILSRRDVDTLVQAGLHRGIDSIFIGSVAMLRPWNIRSVIRRAHQLLA
ncbi:hypothetical protein A3D66_00520 [Candidatus Kaiserbacteria bacterium RIFCSPHIGHO2_02_FULL_50_9]|uniref:Dihydroorotate dehydrogenase catalytic domain-containing protein n=1 Tax=Candidatus Kaiserbacteria bacterium RIFCSPLOWO2_01_FULL_51_21 TaxID=1798508 RepID=A0A1F6ECU4_9BACT|nr:MAG: hypothetical protein A3D66_00520 [Candidatus Kaiserbacteria bacterium RIFCSPHIGHO2_02_FULL_50_9]OGG71437.1 MAG: hypothetical protein A3A35_03250 [Candidatus Kaiserbacteria bacterium RIFCSPLOWO2_01_FULL_51_21]